ncbi:hypothetical protein AtubIFM55763_010582 [Aspergillus tubingensis]|uniref:Uncharacterized protein n=1 Tax=Aspergillus tubingensis TaxID=5068 RepID=A0A8H3T685_ASPTU|nr:DUF3328 domain protein [Aspergillus tubingensis]GFN21418.1 DUF3328 domain protein [Aspergillus tubingensis]GLA78095.1 hypothetical protein AtubIFM55763_010582 [Aspergillus tubingensis]GLA83767.1 hypothetical protein AtubIFM56815_007973 [Aspergillus tubingensis]
MALQLSDCGYEKKVDWEDSLLNDERDAFLVDELHNLLSSTPRIMVKLSIMLLALSGLLNILLLIFIGQQYSQRGASNPIFPHSIYSPIQEALRYKEVLFSSGFGNERTKYMGNSTAADKAWYELYPRTVLRIPKASADQLVNKTIPIAGSEDQFPVLISVFHELHCLDSIRHLYYGHVERFSEDPVINKAILAPGHIDHCFDSLRQTIMCNADISPIPYQWVESRGKALGSLGVLHTCRDYDALLEWAMQPEHDIGDWDETVKPSTIP